MAAARAAETALTSGAELGPLHGVTATVKDLADVAGLPTERGSHISKGNIATVDTPFVARLKQAGAVLLGKTTTSELRRTRVTRTPPPGIPHTPRRPGHNAAPPPAGGGAAAARGLRRGRPGRGGG